jgi:hypothetical protein|nr:hypothetical protein [Chlorobium sp.]
MQYHKAIIPVIPFEHPSRHGEPVKRHKIGAVGRPTCPFDTACYLIGSKTNNAIIEPGNRSDHRPELLAGHRYKRRPIAPYGPAGIEQTNRFPHIDICFYSSP